MIPHFGVVDCIIVRYDALREILRRPSSFVEVGHLLKNRIVAFYIVRIVPDILPNVLEADLAGERICLIKPCLIKQSASWKGERLCDV